MREHTRNNGRYMRTESGTLTVDWGSNGADYNAIDFSYVAKGRMGNLSTIYGQVRRTPGAMTYDTFDVKAGRNRNITSKSETIDSAIRKHITLVTGENTAKLDVVGKIPIPPNTIRTEMKNVITKAIIEEQGLWSNDCNGLSETQKMAELSTFAENTWNCAWQISLTGYSDKHKYKKVGLLDVDVSEKGKLNIMWRSYLQQLVGEA